MKVLFDLIARLNISGIKEMKNIEIETDSGEKVNICDIRFPKSSDYGRVRIMEDDAQITVTISNSTEKSSNNLLTIRNFSLKQIFYRDSSLWSASKYIPDGLFVIVLTNDFSQARIKEDTYKRGEYHSTFTMTFSNVVNADQKISDEYLRRLRERFLRKR